MYILKTTTGDSIKIDADELLKIEEADTDQLIYFRQGAVLKRMIALVVEDPDKGREGPREIGKSTSQPRRQEDIFQHLRGPQPKRLT